MAAMALLAAACSSSSPSSTGADGPPNAGGTGVAYSQCVRSHGIPSFPDPDSSGQVPKQTAQQLGVSLSVFASATHACAQLNPGNKLLLSPAQQRQVLSNGLTLARCLRSHGVPTFPDPTMGPNGPRFVISTSRDNFNVNSPQIAAKGHECLRELPAGAQLPSTTVVP
jgi:hypothetical protein